MTKTPDELLEILNTAWSYLEPISYNDFNVFIQAKSPSYLMNFEKQNPEIGIAQKPKYVPEARLGMSTCSLIATITDLCVGKRLAVMLDEQDIIIGFCWYKEK
jgi:hypothetical protein